MFSGYIADFDTGADERLQYLYVSLSNLCNARCSYCDVHSAPPPVREFGDRELLAIFGRARDLGCHTVHFLGGGEPLVAPQFPAAIDSCARLGLKVVITTNGSHLAQRAKTALQRVRCDAIIVSLDSHLAAEHDAIRGMRRLWQRAEAGIRACREHLEGTHVILNHVLTRHNVEVVAGFSDWAAAAGAGAVNLIPVKDAPDLAIEQEQAERLDRGFGRLLARARRQQVDLLCLAEDVTHWARTLRGAPSDREYRCVFPRHSLYIDFPTGSVYPCDCTVHRDPASTFDVGNVWRHQLSDIWRGQAVDRLRATLESTCDPGCKHDCDWNNRRTNEILLAGR